MKYYYGETIRAGREAANMTQAQLAEKWPRADGGTGVSVNYVSDVERGIKNITDPHTLRRLCNILHIPVWKMGFSDYNPFDFMAGQEDALQSLQYGLEGRKVDLEVVEWANKHISLLSQLDDDLGGKKLYPLAQNNLFLLQDLLKARAASSQVEQKLRFAIAQAARLTAWLAQDAGYDHLVSKHYRLGIEMARSTNNNDFAAYCIAMMAFRAVDNGDPELCLTLLEGAGTEAAKDSPLHIALTQWTVQPLGLLGDIKSAAQNLVKADTLWERRDADRIPDWLYWIWRPSDTPEVPRGFINDDPKTAIQLLESGLRAIESDFPRDRTLILMGLAEACASAGRLDEALSTANEIMKQLPDGANPRVQTRLAKFGKNLSNDPISKEFKERLLAYKAAQTRR